jgi:hypothetical protein
MLQCILFFRTEIPESKVTAQNILSLLTKKREKNIGIEVMEEKTAAKEHFSFRMEPNHKYTFFW